jgi:hypothetical protein
LKQSGGKAYLMRYHEPVRDEHQIMLEQGSGKYRLVLAANKISPAASNEVARYDFEVYNPQYPPRIPKEVWVNDPRNRRWEALLPKETHAQPGATGTMLDAMKMYKEIRTEVREEIEPEEPRGTNDVLATMKAAKELFGSNGIATAPAKDPLEIAVALFTTMNQMKAENPVIDMYRDQLKSMQEELREMRKAQVATPPAKGLIEQIVETVGGDNKVDMLKRLFNNGSSDSGPARRTTGMDLARELGTKLFEGPVGEGLGQLLGSFASRNVNGNGIHWRMQGNGAQITKGSPEHLARFIELTVNPALLSHYVRGMSGSDFAAWLADGGYMDELAQLQNFTHPQLPGQRGPQAIITAYKHTPLMWPTLSSQGENRFIQFVNEFCAWQPEAEEEALDVDAVMDEGPEEEEGPERI